MSCVGQPAEHATQNRVIAFFRDETNSGVTLHPSPVIRFHPDNVVRTVTENSRTLKFTSQGFEEE